MVQKIKKFFKSIYLLLTSQEKQKFEFLGLGFLEMMIAYFSRKKLCRSLKGSIVVGKMALARFRDLCSKNKYNKIEFIYKFIDVFEEEPIFKDRLSWFSCCEFLIHVVSALIGIVQFLLKSFIQQ